MTSENGGSLLGCISPYPQDPRFHTCVCKHTFTNKSDSIDMYKKYFGAELQLLITLGGLDSSAEEAV